MKRHSARRLSRPVLALGLLLFALGVRAELVDRVAAVVNNEIITLGDVMKRASADLQRSDQDTPPEKRAKKHEEITLKVLDAIIDEHLLDQEVREAKISVDDKQIDLGVQDVMKRYNLNADQLAQAVVNEGLTMGEYREQMRKQLGRFQLMREKVAKLVKITDADIRTEYDRMARDEGKEIEVHVRHIVVSVAENAPSAEVMFWRTIAPCGGGSAACALPNSPEGRRNVSAVYALRRLFSMVCGLAPSSLITSATRAWRLSTVMVTL